jgi:preprotein translocase subunit SecA
MELNLSGDTDSDFCTSRHWNWNCSYRKEKLDRKDAEAEEKNNYFKISESKASVFHIDTTFKAYALFEKDVEYVIMDNIMIVDEQTVVSWMVVVILTDYTKRLKPKKM